jgi:hypothetical protein
MEFAPMKRLATDPAEWRGHGTFKRAYELRSDAALYATLKWESALGSLAQAQAAEASWTLKRVGFFNPRATVRAPDSETDLAVFHPNWVGNGRVELTGGRTWRFQCLNFWHSKYGFIDDAGESLIEYQANVFKTPPTAKVVVSPLALTLRELPLLVVLGWYVTILTFDDAAGIAAASGG